MVLFPTVYCIFRPLLEYNLGCNDLKCIFLLPRQSWFHNASSFYKQITKFMCSIFIWKAISNYLSQDTVMFYLKDPGQQTLLFRKSQPQKTRSDPQRCILFIWLACFTPVEYFSCPRGTFLSKTCLTFPETQFHLTQCFT